MNKRDFGFGHYFRPTLENSRKRLVMELLGDDYDRAVEFEDRLETQKMTFALLDKITA